MHFRFAALLALALVTEPLRAAEVAAAGINASFFDPAGKLTHKLLAKRGSLAGGLRQLQQVEILYVAANDPRVIVQRVEAAEATWDERAEVLTGRGPILVATTENRLTGEGFDFALATSLLHIHRRFRMENRELLLASDRATVELVVDRAGDNVKFRDVKRCEALGHLEIAVQPTAKQSYAFARLFSERAVYEGATQIITLPDGVRSVKNGREATFDILEINLRK